ncbi:SDR family NAD(P)-dependent oxidoreductase [Qipengyuania sp. MTN3-11]|uniref:SDR family NAD(P)-dependent oxidoreductase n=1 Tax=Qipengyuania sp. MTN3-11 TaxID=3056557 RepID=UPI0036F39964
MADKSILIIGASRGIGLGLAKAFAARGWHVHATERDRSDDLHAAAENNVMTVHTADVTDPKSYAGLGLDEGSLDVILINAGITGADHQDAAKATAEEVAHVMMTNAFGPARAGKELLPLIKDGGTLGFTTSLMGSIADSSGGYDLYRTSKAAQNMLAKGTAEQDARGRDIQVLSLHPGWVQTDMGGPDATLTIEESVTGLADVIASAGGGGYRFVDYKNADLPF